MPDQYNSLDWDRYAYVRNNPVNATDSSGHCIDGVSTIVCIAVAITVVTQLLTTGDAPKRGPGEAASVSDLVIAGLQHEKQANIVNEGLQSLLDDPSVKDAQDRIVDRIASAPEYGEQPFSINEDISDSFTADGPNGNWKEAAVTGNQAFWMVRNGTLSATNTKVSADGTISTTWHINDNFDFIPGPDRSEDYNYWASKVHYIYNELLGAEETFPADAYWKEIIPPQ